jgi:hypothetical protein
VPAFAELLLTHSGAWAVRQMFTPGRPAGPIRPGACSREEIEGYAAAFLQPGAATAALNYYRCAAGGAIRRVGGGVGGWVRAWIALGALLQRRHTPRCLGSSAPGAALAAPPRHPHPHPQTHT